MAEVIGIFLAPTHASPTVEHQEVRAVAGHGLKGDRHFNEQGTHASDNPKPYRELTLIEMEMIEKFNDEHDTNLSPGEIRRNFITRGISLNDLVDKEFTIGEVRARGMKLCEPCRHLASLTTPWVLEGLLHQGGLYAQILSGGTIKVGDAIKEVAALTAQEN